MPDSMSMMELYRQLSESMKLVFDLASRTDERVKSLVDNNGKVETKIDRIFNILNELSNSTIINKVEIEKYGRRIEDIDTRLAEVEATLNGISNFKSLSESRWKTFGDVFWKILVAVASATVIYYFGLHAK